MEAVCLIDVPLIDLDGTAESTALSTNLDALDRIDIVELDWDQPQLTASDADDILDDDDHFTLIVIPDAFAESLANGGRVSVSL